MIPELDARPSLGVMTTLMKSLHLIAFLVAIYGVLIPLPMSIFHSREPQYLHVPCRSVRLPTRLASHLVCSSTSGVE
jgi:hypothetical protein